MSPYGIYGDRALGSRKWDVDGNEYVDYYGGHGSLLLGHGHPKVLAAVQAQLGKGMHLAAAHALEVEWAHLIRRWSRQSSASGSRRRERRRRSSPCASPAPRRASPESCAS
jgi:glutamate-1-semialdehyde aminotransferase